jgi:RNA polymerase sigma-70 factor (ECF subfamily)
MANSFEFEGLIREPDSSVQGPVRHSYADVIATYGAALGRLAKAYEANPDSRADLLQEIQVAVWKSLQIFDGRCSLRTWLYRVAHNVALRHLIQRRRKASANLLSLDEVGELSDNRAQEAEVERHVALERVFNLIQQLRPVDRQVFLLYLEGMDAHSIGEITGISPGNVAIRVHRIKAILTERFHGGPKQ